MDNDIDIDWTNKTFSNKNIFNLLQNHLRLFSDIKCPHTVKIPVKKGLEMQPYIRDKSIRYHCDTKADTIVTKTSVRFLEVSA